MRRKKSVITGRAQAAHLPKRLIRAQAPRAPRAVNLSTPEQLLRSRGIEPVLERERPLVVNLTVDLAPARGGALALRNPVLVASGVFGYGLEYLDAVDIQALGAICTRGTTLKARGGNPPPRVAESPGGLLNSVGLQNPGIEAVLERHGARWSAWDVPVILNLAAGSVEDFVAIARKVDGQPGVAAIELNLSCPNANRGGLQFALDPDAAGQVTAAVRRATDLPLLVKVSPGASNVRAVAESIEEAGADAISATNTLTGLAIDRRRRSPLLGNVYAGLSGPALKPIALRVVYELAQEVSIPIVGIGGVTSLEDVLDYLFAGASAVGVGTAVFADPTLPVRLINELETYCREERLATYRELVGVAQPRGRARQSAKGAEYRP